MFKKIFIGFVLIFILGITLTGMISNAVTKNIYLTQMEEKLIEDGYLVIDYVFDFSLPEDTLSIENIKPIEERTKERITLINQQGVVLYDTDKNSEDMGNHINRPEVMEALQGKIGKEIRQSQTLGQAMMYVALPVVQEREVNYVVRLSIPLERIHSITSGMLRSTLIVGLIGLMITVILSYRYLYSMTTPLKQITALAREMSGGNLSKRISLFRQDELGELATAFNDMADKLQDSMEELKDRNLELESILGSMINGVVAVDLHHRIMMINPSAKVMLNITDGQDIVGANILEVIRNHKLYHGINEFLHNRTKEPMEIILDQGEKRIVKIYINPIKYLSKLERVKGIIIIMQDVTELRQLESIRRDFVANVSHELKTPITSIKGFVDTLSGGQVRDRKTQERFLKIISLEVERLTHLIEDILTLSHLESKPQDNQGQSILIPPLMESIFQMIQPLAQKKEIELRKEYLTPIPQIPFNPEYFKQMMINLLDNAIKYTPHGGRVWVEFMKKDNALVIKIQDNGIGIPREDIPRLFERFYRVDKGRTREEGGTGLGLAIVKHIVQGVKGEIKVESERGKGTIFTIALPLLEE